MDSSYLDPWNCSRVCPHQGGLWALSLILWADPYPSNKFLYCWSGRVCLQLNSTGGWTASWFVYKASLQKKKETWKRYACVCVCTTKYITVQEKTDFVLLYIQSGDRPTKILPWKCVWRWPWILITQLSLHV